jgi:hypothetical protein
VGQVELVVPVTGDDQGRNGLNSAGKQSQHVERRLVRPVHVLQHEDSRRTCPQFAHERRDNLVWLHATRYDLLELAAGAIGDLEQWTERRRGEKWIAAAPEDPRRLTALCAEAPQECCLSHAGLAAHEHDAPP